MAERFIPSQITPSRERVSDLRTEVYGYKILATVFAGLAAAVGVGTAVELFQIPLDQLPKEIAEVLPVPALVLTYVGGVFDIVYRGRERRLQGA